MYLVSTTPTKLELSPLPNLDSDHISSCTSAGSVLQLCKVSQKSNKPSRRSCAYKELYTVVIHYLQMCMKEYGCCPKFGRGDNLTYTLKYVLYGEMGL
jgi:hypothetical protein